MRAPHRAHVEVFVAAVFVEGFDADEGAGEFEADAVLEFGRLRRIGDFCDVEGRVDGADRVGEHVAGRLVWAVGGIERGEGESSEVGGKPDTSGGVSGWCGGFFRRGSEGSEEYENRDAHGGRWPGWRC